MRTLVILGLLSTLAASADAAVFDRVAIVVGRRAVKASDIERDLRASELLNRKPLDVSEEAKRDVSERLIEQELIRQEMMTGSWDEPTDTDVDGFITQLRDARFHGSDAEFSQALSQYGLTKDQFRTYARWQLTALRFIDQRFRPGVLVTDEDIRDYYEQHRDQLRKTLEDATPQIRETITGERINQAFEEWLKQIRTRTRVTFIPAAFGGKLPQSATGEPEP